jgi:hypothetical protein
MRDCLGYRGAGGPPRDCFAHICDRALAVDAFAARRAKRSSAGVTRVGVIHPSGLRWVDGRSWVRSSGVLARRSYALRTTTSLLFFSAGDPAAGSRYRVRAEAIGLQAPGAPNTVGAVRPTRIQKRAAHSNEIKRGAAIRRGLDEVKAADALDSGESVHRNDKATARATLTKACGRRLPRSGRRIGAKHFRADLSILVARDDARR